MNLAASVLGTATVEKLKETQGAPVLQIGSDRFTRGDLAHVECYNFHAARLLTNALRELKVPNVKYVYEKVSPSDLALPHMGAISLAVLGAAFEAKGIGGSQPLLSYVKRHLHEGGKVVTFSTVKLREHAEIARENKEKKRRKAQRRDQAQEIRVERFEERTENGAKS